MYFERDYQTAGRFFQRALRIAPGNATVLSNAAVYASTIGQLDRAEELTLASMLRDPVSPVIHSNYASLLNRMGRHTESIESASKAIGLRPDMYSAIVNTCQAYLLGEQAETALECVEDLTGGIYPYFLEAVINHTLGRQDDVDRALAALMDEDPDEVALYLARAYAWMKQTDLAFDWLDRRISGTGNIMGMKTDWAMRSLHSDPRWQDRLQRVGLTDEQVADFRL
jgi:tetratricopeptide (TPR) repeat protein